MNKMRKPYPKTTINTPVIKLDREKFREYCRSNGHSELSLSAAFSSANYIRQRFTRYDGVFPESFVTWCNQMFPSTRENLEECVIREPEPEPVPEKPEAPKTEQMAMVLPSVTKDKIITIQPVSLVGINQVVDALNRISEQLAKLEEAWNGHCG